MSTELGVFLAAIAGVALWLTSTAVVRQELELYRRFFELSEAARLNPHHQLTRERFEEVRQHLVIKRVTDGI